jgi:hypothetical protein
MIAEHNTLNNNSLTKCTDSFIIGIGTYLESELIQQMKKHFFSIFIDETTDVTTSTQIAVVIQYLDA